MDMPGRITPTNADGDGALLRNIDQAAAGSHEAIQEVADAARPTVDRISSGAHQAVDKIADVASQAADTLSATGGQLKEAQERLVEDAGRFMRNNPVASLGIAVAAGFLLSRLFSSR
ncbi:MAG: hypothetical protein ABI724_09325 [Betaproteobacteria bacterium]